MNKSCCNPEHLRIATPQENSRNRKCGSDNKQGMKCVGSTPYGFRAFITINGKRINLGCFKSKEDAHAAYCRAGREAFGEFFNAG
jgi:hypothetical protein